jgi:hypothetical protein
LLYGAMTTLLATPAIALLETSLAGTVDWRTFLGRLLPLLLHDGILILPLWVFLHRSILRPLQALTRADRATEAGQAEGKYIPEEAMPDHELGEVMRRRNAMVFRLEELQARAEAKRREEEEAATRLAHSLLGVVTFEEIGAAAFPALRERLAPDALSLMVIDPSKSMLELVAAEGWSEEYIGRLQLPLSPPESSGAAWALHTRTPVVKDHSASSPASSTPDPVRSAGVQMSLHPQGLRGTQHRGPRPGLPHPAGCPGRGGAVRRPGGVQLARPPSSPSPSTAACCPAAELPSRGVEFRIRRRPPGEPRLHPRTAPPRRPSRAGAAHSAGGTGAPLRTRTPGAPEAPFSLHARAPGRTMYVPRLSGGVRCARRSSPARATALPR